MKTNSIFEAADQILSASQEAVTNLPTLDRILRNFCLTGGYSCVLRTQVLADDTAEVVYLTEDNGLTFIFAVNNDPTMLNIAMLIPDELYDDVAAVWPIVSTTKGLRLCKSEGHLAVMYDMVLSDDGMLNFRLARTLVLFHECLEKVRDKCSVAGVGERPETATESSNLDMCCPAKE